MGGTCSIHEKNVYKALLPKPELKRQLERFKNG
jgi:hypothetical protein